MGLKFNSPPGTTRPLKNHRGVAAAFDCAAPANKREYDMMKTKTAHQRIQFGVWLPTLIGLVIAAASAASALGQDNRAPEVPDEIAVDASTNRVHFHGFAVGFQVYTWNGTNWGAPVPDAILFHGEGIVATHFVGPTWESDSGSRVVGAVVQPTVTVDTNAIPWVRLRAVTTEGPGIFAGTTFIQRVNTTGGRAPSAAGTAVGQVARMPY